MARGAPSPADQQVVGELAARGVVVTASQLEGWRRSGLLSRHRRRGLGRGIGSVVDAVDPVVVESAAALARHARQGRDRRLAVADWFAEAGESRQLGDAVVPEPPMNAVREALLWIESRDDQPLLDVLRMTPSLGTDALYAEVTRLITARSYPEIVHPAVVRAAVSAGERPPRGIRDADSVHLFAAAVLGHAEIGADALAEALAGLLSFDMTAEGWGRMLRAVERGEDPQAQAFLQNLLDQIAAGVSPLRQASDAELVRARTVLHGLQPFYVLYMLHGLALPDTPGLAALRERIDERGMGLRLTQTISFTPIPLYFVRGVTGCLLPELDALYEDLMEQYTANPKIFDLPDHTDGFLGFLDAWNRTLEEHTPTGHKPGSPAADRERRKVARNLKQWEPGLGKALKVLIGWALKAEEELL
ncbi:hypothetical protein [Streptomyces bottropensis]|uniref:hypothetical protein n=1 Tax=Streptomyces bottropensis TaxID=42235 RepID=UPI00367A5F16